MTPSEGKPGDEPKASSAGREFLSDMADGCRGCLLVIGYYLWACFGLAVAVAILFALLYFFTG